MTAGRRDDVMIRVENLTAAYGDQVVLDRLSFEIYRGEVFVILGGSGCGKSTLLKHLIGLYEPASGSVFLDGEDIVSAAGAARRAILRKIGVMYQSGALFGSMSLLENVRLPLEEFTRLPREAMEARSLYEKLYCARGEMENRIKEQQLALFADRTSTAYLRSNQLRLYLSSFAYCLMQSLRRLGLAGTEMAKAQCQTIRLKLLKVGAQIKITVRKVWLHLSAGHPGAALFAAVYRNLQAAALRC